MLQLLEACLLWGAFGIHFVASQTLSQNCPVFGFEYHLENADLLRHEQTTGWSACALLCNQADASSAAATHCSHFQYNAATGRCSLYSSPPPQTGKTAPLVVSGRYPVLLAGGPCASSAVLSEWGPWMPFGVGPEGAATEGPPAMLQRTRTVLRGPLYGTERLPALRQLRPAAEADCVWNGVGILGWGCDASASFDESAHSSVHATSIAECMDMCKSRHGCTFASFEASGNSQAGGRCFLIYGEPGCFFLSRRHVSAKNGGPPCWLQQQRSCKESETFTPAECPVACRMSEWSEWSPCAGPCGAGMQHRQRFVLQQPHGGAPPCGTLTATREKPASLNGPPVARVAGGDRGTVSV
ncbi:thrombospondin type 1 domain-containing protein [Cyclospora cayetanensis]|uniref:Thrombospondin type 1 domain-containing protein n=1 Tax=Cyclospora cayetanensis TaxID=88456 RepID=A0A1D3CTQ4_9EIME|nr:thrombospondin type 1 domain-containing protein [Cyclospora cayetanensis]